MLLLSCQVVSQFLLADAVTGKIFIGILVVTPDVLTDPAVALNPLTARAALVKGQWNIVLAGHVPGQGNVGPVVRPKYALTAGVAEFNLDRSILIGRHPGPPGNNPRTLHLVDRPAVADNEVGVGLTAVGRPLHETGRLLSIGPTAHIVQDNVL